MEECTIILYSLQLLPPKVCTYHDSQIIANEPCAMIPRVSKLFQTSQSIFHKVRRLHNSKIKNLDLKKQFLVRMHFLGDSTNAFSAKPSQSFMNSREQPQILKIWHDEKCSHPSSKHRYKMSVSTTSCDKDSNQKVAVFKFKQYLDCHGQT